MSMNLHAKTCSGTIDLWQTPTYITRMCLMSASGQKNRVKGKRATRALRCYIEYCRGTLDGSWSSSVDLQLRIESFREHKKFIDTIINEKSLEVYMM